MVQSLKTPEDQELEQAITICPGSPAWLEITGQTFEEFCENQEQYRAKKVPYDPDAHVWQGTVAFMDANGDIDIDRMFSEMSHQEVIDHVFANFLKRDTEANYLTEDPFKIV